MSTILVDVLVGLMLLLFAVMAIGPMLLASKPTSRPTSSSAEDRVISVSPVPMIERQRPHARQWQPHPLGGHLPATGGDERDAA